MHPLTFHPRAELPFLFHFISKSKTEQVVGTCFPVEVCCVLWCVHAAGVLRDVGGSFRPWRSEHCYVPTPPPAPV
jgi:hypothetical protein